MQSEHNASYWIEKLNLVEHTEGGFFAPVFRAPEYIDSHGLPARFKGNRTIVSSIYYLLQRGQFSAFHRLKSFEIWSFLGGDPLVIYILNPFGGLTEKRLGPNFDRGESFLAAIEPGNWFAAEQRGPAEFTLLGCMVAPGFEYEDMEIAGRDRLLAKYPEHREIIERLAR